MSRETAEHSKFLRDIASRVGNNENIQNRLHDVADHMDELAATIVMNNRLFTLGESQESREEMDRLWNEVKTMRRQMVTQLDLENALMASTTRSR